MCLIFEKNPEELNENTRFVEDLGAKSGNITQITTFLEDEYDIEIAFMKFRRKKTVGEAAEFVEELINE